MEGVDYLLLSYEAAEKENYYYTSTSWCHAFNNPTKKKSMCVLPQKANLNAASYKP